MGYYSHVTGSFVVRPALSDKLLHEFWPNGGGGEDEFFELTPTQQSSEEVKVVDGELTIVGSSWTTLDPYDDSYKAYDLEANVQRLFGRIKAEGGYQVEGWITVSGEESGDIWRLKAEPDGTITNERARIVWPDGTPVE